MNDKNQVVVNENEPIWDLNISKLRLCSRISLFIGKKHIKNNENNDQGCNPDYLLY